MHLTELVRIACIIAASSSRRHVELVTPAGSGEHLSSELVQVSNILGRHCQGTSNYLRPISLNDEFWCGPSSKGRRCAHSTAKNERQILFVMNVASIHHLELLRRSEVWKHTSAKPWLLSFTEELFQTAQSVLTWNLDNQVICLVSNGHGESAWEVYRPGLSTPPVINHLTALNAPPLEEQLDVIRKEPWSRRTNLTGLTVRCSVLHYFQYVKVTRAPGGRVVVAGWAADIWDILSSTLGFRFECAEPEDGLWGAILPIDKPPVGVVGDVASGKADVGIPYFTLESHHFKHVDALYPIDEIWHVLVLRRPSSVDRTSNYSKELTWQSWTAAGVLFFSSIFITKILVMFSDTNGGYTLSHSLICNIRIFCNMGWGEVEPRGAALRTWTLTLLVAVMVLHISYSSSLITILTSVRPVLPFTHLQGLYDARDQYTLGFEKDSFIENSFLRANSGLLQKVQEDIIAAHPEYVEEFSRGMTRVSEQDKHAFLAPVQLVKKDCDLMMLPRKYFQQQMLMIIRKDFTAAPIISHTLQVMKESGLLQRLARKWLLTKDLRDLSCSALPASPLGLEETYIAFLMLVAGVGAGFGFLMGEIVVKNFSKYSNTSTKT